MRQQHSRRLDCNWMALVAKNEVLNVVAGEALSEYECGMSDVKVL